MGFFRTIKTRQKRPKRERKSGDCMRTKHLLKSENLDNLNPYNFSEEHINSEQIRKILNLV